jgi:hypothetical protein
VAFHDTGRVDELHLADTVSIRDDNGNWITGKVIELALLEDDPEGPRRVVLKIKNPDETVSLDRTPDTMTVIEWGDDE